MLCRCAHDPPQGGTEYAQLTDAAANAEPEVGKTLTEAGGEAKNERSNAVRSVKFINPTGGQVRQCDQWGCGFFAASRDGGLRTHKGADYIATLNQEILAAADGVVYKLGFPYGDDLSYRYVGIETPSGHRIRHMYVDPGSNIQIGVKVSAGQVIGRYQSLQKRFPGITEHVHVDIEIEGRFIDPVTLIP